MSKEKEEEAKGTCFVVMGFGKKTDFETSRTLDLDKTYRNIIKPAVEAAGLRCLRADEIVHSGLIDVPMYERLLNADVVVADLSTSNKNAFYELGVRHALRPATTIVICEDGLKPPPFDLSHVLIRPYHHMGEGIDYDEVERFRKHLTDAIVEIYNQDPRPSDSPVYAFIENLTPPAKAAALHAMAEGAAKSSPAAVTGGGTPPEGGEGAGVAQTYSELMQEADDAQQAGDFEEAKSLLKVVRKRMKAGKPDAPENPYIIQRLALVTYKAKHETPEQEIAALREACDLLYTLNPTTSNDPETLGLWGAVHKRLWDKAGDAVALDKAVRSYERGFYLRDDYYNGINFAYMLNIRAAHAAGLAKTSADPAQTAAHRASAIADFIRAQRVRKEVLSICNQWLATNPEPDEKASAETRNAYLESKYWVVATRAEAYLGTGNVAEAEKDYQQAETLINENAEAFTSKPWIKTSAPEQRAKLEPLLNDSPLKYVKEGGE